jgi:hypothetical protein
LLPSTRKSSLLSSNKEDSQPMCRAKPKCNC